MSKLPPDNPNNAADDKAPIVLLIDDCEDVHRLLRARLRSETIDLVSAETGEKGLAFAREGSPAIILLDLDMPGMDGFEVLRALKDDPQTLDIPVIVLSGLQSPHDKVTAFDLGAVDYITKPFELTELRVRVRSALRLHTLMRMLAQKAQIDGLTGLWNRVYFDERWNDECERARRHDKPLSLAVIDLDHFKSINDTYGHPAGDAVIQGLAKLIGQQTRVSDISCRYGGEEFVVIMTETSPEDAQGVCDRIRAELEKIEWPRHPKRKVTLSCGIAGATGSCEVDRLAWLEAADQALYAAKQGGRNQVRTTDLQNSPSLKRAG